MQLIQKLASNELILRYPEIYVEVKSDKPIFVDVLRASGVDPGNFLGGTERPGGFESPSGKFLKIWAINTLI
jgi:hypothetical protein